MLAVISPAKRLVEGPALAELPHTQPAMLTDTRKLVKVARELDADDLQALMGISEPLAALNVARFASFRTPFTPDNARQAIRMFAGDTYAGFDAPTLTPEDLVYAQDHVAILSGLYGVVRPLDLVQPYRLEMGTKLATDQGSNLVAFWGDRIAKRLRAQLRGHADRTLVNLASHEYVSAVDRDALGVRVVTPVFQDIKDGKARTLGMFAKHARGAMARFLVQHRVEEAEALQAATPDGYRYVPELSDETTWVYQRPQPPPVGR